MPEYAKMKNADLEALLKERGLPTGGKKADMVDRLTKDDAKKATETKVPAVEDEINWDDDGDDEPIPAPKANETVTSIGNTPALATGSIEAGNTVQPATTTDETAQPSTDIAADITADAQAEDKKAPAADFSEGLAATSLDEEIEKRKKRAAKFGLKIEDDEGLKKLERAKKFGNTGPPKGLDEALPERSLKRGREGGDDSRDYKRRGGGRGGGRGGRGGRDNRRDDRRDNHRGNRNSNDREPRKEGARSNGASTWMSEKDRAAAEARKAKWGTT